MLGEPADLGDWSDDGYTYDCGCCACCGCSCELDPTISPLHIPGGIMNDRDLERIEQELDYCRAFDDQPPMWAAEALFAEVKRLRGEA